MGEKRDSRRGVGCPTAARPVKQSLSKSCSQIHRDKAVQARLLTLSGAHPLADQLKVGRMRLAMREGNKRWSGPGLRGPMGSAGAGGWGRAEPCDPGIS